MVNIRCIIFLFSIYNIQAKTIQSDQDGAVQEPNNILLKDNDDLKVDLDICEDNYEIAGKTYTELRIENEDTLFKKFNRMASKEYEIAMKRSRADERLKDQGTKSKIFMMDRDNRTLSHGTPSNVRMSQTRNSNDTNEKVEHDLLSKFYANALEQPSDCGVQDALQQITSTNNSHIYVREQRLNGIGIEAVKRLVVEFYTKQVNKSLTKHFWKIAAVWVVVYLVIAVPLWFTQGWGSCCLCCKFFKPQQTIQEAKNYLLLNPPGILVTKKGVIIYYEPTEREKYCYEEFGHFLRTL